MRIQIFTLPFLTLLFLTLNLLSPLEVPVQPLVQVIYTPTPMEVQTAEQVIEAVNSLRLANGLTPLNTHPVLMQVARWEVDALANGAGGHARPNGLTLGQWLLSLGYPLSGDLSLDGYRSENVVFGPGFTVQDAISLWMGDDPHTNTMLSPNRSDIGAAVASNVDEWGFTVYYYVLETDLQTNSGKMQSAAYSILTAIASNQSAYSTSATQSAADSLLPQYIIPVICSTAQPDGDVFHKVQYGQSLWSIAITYGTTINQIRAWNNLGDSTSIYEGQTLLVQKEATQPSPASATPSSPPTPAVTVTPTTSIGFPTVTIQSPSPSPINGGSLHSSSGMWVSLILVAALVGGGMGSWLIRPSKY